LPDSRDRCDAADTDERRLAWLLRHCGAVRGASRRHAARHRQRWDHLPMDVRQRAAWHSWFRHARRSWPRSASPASRNCAARSAAAS